MQLKGQGRTLHLHFNETLRIRVFGHGSVTAAEKQNKQRNYLVAAFTSLIIVLIVKHFWPSLIPFDLGQFWHLHNGGVGDWLSTSWPVLAWGYGLTAVVCFFTRNTRQQNRDAEKYLVFGELVSLWAGIAEEICFRWLIFLGAIVTVVVSNWLFFGGWLFHFGIAEWIQLNAFGPVADFFTRYVLGVIPGFNSSQIIHNFMVNKENWAIGAAILSANAFFRDGHKYEGVFGWVNSWFIGIFFFFMMFQYGLIAAISIHFLYDAGIFAIGYLDRVIERSEGK